MRSRSEGRAAEGRTGPVAAEAGPRHAPDEHDEARRSSHAGGGGPAAALARRARTIQASPRMVAQRERLERTTGSGDAARGGLPDGLRRGMEALSGEDLSDVRVHRGSSRPARLGAHAFAQGSDIHLAPGQERHLPHEAWHVVQQRQGRVPATGRVAGVAVNDDAALEREADRMGSRASSG